MTPAPEPEPEIPFQPLSLRPERVRARGGVVVAQGRLVHVPPLGGQQREEEKEGSGGDGETARVPSCLTFGSAASEEQDQDQEGYGGYGEEGRSLTPVFKRMHAQELESGSWGRTSTTRMQVPAPPSSVFSLSLGASNSGSVGRSSGYKMSVRSGLSFDDEREFGGEHDNDDEERTHSPVLLSEAQRARRLLGMSGGTMGGSDVSAYYKPADEQLDVDDEDSDVPGELREILKVHGRERERERPVEMEEDDNIPVFRASLTDHSSYPPKTTPVNVNAFPSSPALSSSNSHSLPSPTFTSEDDTKKSFDFTGELRKLNESGASDRRSFVEQLENAFRTPARVDLRYGFEVLPPAAPPPLPAMMPGGMGLAAAFEFSSGGVSREEEDEESAFDDDVSRIVDVQLPSWSTSTDVTHANANTNANPNASGAPAADASNTDSLQLASLSISHSKSRSRLMDVKEPSGLLLSASTSSSSSSSSRPSDGELDRSFKFGGLPKSDVASSSKEEKEKGAQKELTLSDIIPPPEHVRSISLAGASLSSSVSRQAQAQAQTHMTAADSDPSADLDSAALEDDSVLKSIYAKILEGLPPAVPRPKRVDPGVANSGVVVAKVHFFRVGFMNRRLTELE